MAIDRNLQRKLREKVHIQDRFRVNNDIVNYRIISNQGLIFEDIVNNFHTFGFLKNRNKNIFYQAWITDYNKPFIFFIHGNAENSSTHPAFIYNCLKQGYNFLTFDQIGYGDSDGIRGIMKSFDEYIENIDLVYEYFYIQILKHNNNPIFYFIGFSMGGLELLYSIIFNKFSNYKDKYIKKIIFLSPYLKNHSRLINPFFEYYFLTFLKCFSYKKLLRESSQKEVLENDENFYINLYRNLTDNREFLVRRKKDIRIHRLNSNKWLAMMIKAQKDIRNRILFCPKREDILKKFEIYFFLSEKDLVVDNMIVLKYCKILKIEKNIFLQRDCYHDFLDYEDRRIVDFYNQFFKILGM